MTGICRSSIASLAYNYNVQHSVPENRRLAFSPIMPIFGRSSKHKSKSTGLESHAPSDPEASTSVPLLQRVFRPKLNKRETAPAQLQTTPKNSSKQKATASASSSRSDILRGTALNAFILTLTTLSSAADNLPAPGFKVAIDILMTAINGVQVIHYSSS